MIISFQHFKLEKEFNHKDTFGKDEELKKEYEKYLNTMNKADKKRFDQLKQLGCVACAKFGRIREPVIHHIRKHTGLSLRPDHQDTIPLCPEHHNMGNESIHHNKKLKNKPIRKELFILWKRRQISFTHYSYLLILLRQKQYT